MVTLLRYLIGIPITLLFIPIYWVVLKFWKSLSKWYLAKLRVIPGSRPPLLKMTSLTLKGTRKLLLGFDNLFRAILP